MNAVFMDAVCLLYDKELVQYQWHQSDPSARLVSRMARHGHCAHLGPSVSPVWSMATKKMEIDLPGHADEVFTVDWSPDGQRVVSGGKDKVLKM